MKRKFKLYSAILTAIFSFAILTGPSHAQTNTLDGLWEVSEMVSLEKIIYSKEEADFVESHVGLKLGIEGRSLNFFYKSCIIDKVSRETLKDATLSPTGHYEVEWSRLGLQSSADNPGTYDVVAMNVYCPGTSKSSQNEMGNLYLDRIPQEDRKGFFTDKHTIFIGNGGSRVLLSIKGLWVVLEKVENAPEAQDVVPDEKNSN